MTPAVEAGQVVLATGHMLDRPDRGMPRFPAEAEGLVAAAVDRVLTRWEVGPADLLVTQGARGTDLLAAEAALARGAAVHLLLPQRRRAFVAESVAGAGGTWVDRFEAVAERSLVAELDDERPAIADDDRYRATNRWMLDHAAATGRAPRRLLAVWDGRSGDGPGGTADMVALARSEGFAVEVVRDGIVVPPEDPQSRQ